MKLNETALEAAAQVAWKDTGREGRFRDEAAIPDYWPVHTSRIVTAYLDALDAEGLADLYEYWCERIEALPVPDEIHAGDTVAFSAGMGQWRLHVCSCDLSPAPADWRILRHARRQWKIGDLVDDTRDLPDGAVVRDQRGFGYTYNAIMDSFSTPASGGAPLKCIAHPRIIWLPENGDES